MATWRSIKKETESNYGRSKKLNYKKPPTTLDAIDEGPDLKEAPILEELSRKIDEEIQRLEVNRHETTQQIEKIFKKCHEKITRLEKEFLADLDETCREKKGHLKSQQVSVDDTLRKVRSLEEGNQLGSTIGSQPIAYDSYDALDNSVRERSADWSTSVGDVRSFSQSLRGHNHAARDAPISGSNHMQPLECSYVDVSFSQMKLLHTLDLAVETHVRLISAKASPAKTQVNVGSALVDHVTDVKVVTFYSDGEDCEEGGEPLNAQVSCPDGCKLAGTVVDNANGTYVVSFKPTHPGSHILTLTIQDTPIGHSPYDIYVSPVCPSKSTAHTTPCMVDYAGLTTITTRDSNGAQCFFGGDQVDADLRDPHGTPLRCTIDDNKNGTYHVTYNPNIAGIHSMKISIHGEEIKDNPLEIPVRAISAMQTSVKIKRPRLGRPSHVMVQAIDHRGKRLRHGGDHIAAHLYDEKDHRRRCLVKDNKNGSYTITYTAEVPGEYILDIKVHHWSLSGDKMFVIWVPPKQPGCWQKILDKWDDIWDFFDREAKKNNSAVSAKEAREYYTTTDDEYVHDDGNPSSNDEATLSSCQEKLPDDEWCIL